MVKIKHEESKIKIIVFSNLTDTKLIEQMDFEKYTNILYVIFSDIPYTSTRTILIEKSKSNFIKMDKLYIISGNKIKSVSKTFLNECAKSFYGSDEIDVY